MCSRVEQSLSGRRIRTRGCNPLLYILKVIAPAVDAFHIIRQTFNPLYLFTLSFFLDLPIKQTKEKERRVMKSYGVSADTISYLFTSGVTTQEKMDSLAGTVLGQGIDYFQDGDYENAAKRFRQAAALSPQSDNAFSAYNYLGQAYNEMGETDKAVKAYKEAIQAFSTTYNGDDTFYVALGDLYFQEGNTEDAIEAYKNAVRVDPNNEASRYSLAQSYLNSGDLDKAYEHFSEVVRINPKDAAGYYGLGEVARAEGSLNEAVTLFKKSISTNSDFELAYRDLGYAYADLGEFDRANEQLSVLETNNSDYASDLESYITEATAPEILGAYSTSGFPTALGPKTQVSMLSSKLSEANKSKLFSMTVSFSKEMDASSVIDSQNWTISRATLLKNGGVYNYGSPVTSTEATIASTPAFVTFDEETNTATVYFRISQNKDANATLDPRHIVFKFAGVDAYGKSMDASADEYAGFSGIA